MNVEPRSWREAVYPVPPRVPRVALPADTACANGLDDDGDGAADYPADAGGVSPEDDGRARAGAPCDNGVDEDHYGAADYPVDPGRASPSRRTKPPSVTTASTTTATAQRTGTATSTS